MEGCSHFVVLQQLPVAPLILVSVATASQVFDAAGLRRGDAVTYC